jgi:hypothetical protein
MVRCSTSKDRSLVADDRRYSSTDDFSLDDDRRALSSDLFYAEKVRYQRSTVHFHRTAVRFDVDEARALGSEAVASASEPRFVGGTSDSLPFVHEIGKGAIP